jgi:hypothetical protein
MYRSLHLMLAALGIAAMSGTAAQAAAATLATGVLETSSGPSYAARWPQPASAST